MTAGREPPPSLPAAAAGPGLVDLQANGYAGVDFNGPPEGWTAERMERVRAALCRRGVAVVLPTLITDGEERLIARARAYARLLEAVPHLASLFPGLHLEGPFLSPEKGPRGVHPPEHLKTPAQAPEFLFRVHEASGGRLRLVTLAPELPGALSLIERLVQAGIRVGLGHTAASPERILDAVEAGASFSTHLGNGSHPVLPRLDNYVQAQLAEDRLPAGFIADGHHVPFYTLKNFLRAKGYARSFLVTDATSAADRGPGRAVLGPLELHVSENLRVSVPGRAGLAGSALTLDRAVVNVCLYCGIPFEAAWRMASSIPARQAGLPEPSEVQVEVTAHGFSLRGGACRGA